MMRLLPFLICFALGAAPAAGERLTVFAAASLRGVLEDIVAEYPDTVTLSFGGSGTMARQVAAGAPADVIALASPIWMDWLITRGVIAPDAARVIARNTLVVIGAAGAAPLPDTDALLPRLGKNRLAMGQRDAVPAGIYAQTWLRAAGIWPGVSGHLAETDNVRAALALVARGEVPLGIVYATDAAAEPRVAVLYHVPQDLTGPITYPAVALTARGMAFLDHLGSPAASAIFVKHGFEAP